MPSSLSADNAIGKFPPGNDVQGTIQYNQGVFLAGGQKRRITPIQAQRYGSGFYFTYDCSSQRQRQLLIYIEPCSTQR